VLADPYTGSVNTKAKSDTARRERDASTTANCKRSSTSPGCFRVRCLSDNDQIKTIGSYDKDLETTDLRVTAKPYERFNEIHISSLLPFPESKFMHAEISGVFRFLGHALSYQLGRDINRVHALVDGVKTSSQIMGR